MLANQLEVEKEGRDEVYFLFQFRLDEVVCGREVPSFQIIEQVELSMDYGPRLPIKAHPKNNKFGR